MNSPIDKYLDELSKKLPSHSKQWRIILEARDHLLEKAERYEKKGMRRIDAESAAVEDFGQPKNIIHNSLSGLIKSGDIAIEAFRQLWLIASFLFILIGLSGLVSVFLANITSQSFISGDAPGVTYTQARCAEYLKLVPTAHSCTEAAVTHHYGEVVDYRVMVGIIGIIGITLWLLFVKKIKSERLPSLVWLSFTLAITGSLTVISLFLGVMPILFGNSSGAGESLSIGITFLIASVILIVSFFRQSRKFI